MESTWEGLSSAVVIAVLVVTAMVKIQRRGRKEEVGSCCGAGSLNDGRKIEPWRWREAKDSHSDGSDWTEGEGGRCSWSCGVFMRQRRKWTSEKVGVRFFRVSDSLVGNVE